MQKAASNIEKRRIEKSEKAIRKCKDILMKVRFDLSKNVDISNQENNLWNAYNYLEYSILLIKNYINHEIPGRMYSKPRRLPELSQSFDDAFLHVTSALVNFESKLYDETLSDSRVAAQNLREALTSLRYSRMKKKI